MFPSSLKYAILILDTVLFSNLHPKRVFYRTSCTVDFKGKHPASCHNFFNKLKDWCIYKWWKKLLASDTSTITLAIKEESCKYFFIVVNCVHIHCMNIRSMLFSLITFKIRYTQLIGRISHFGIKENIYYI